MSVNKYITNEQFNGELQSSLSGPNYNKQSSSGTMRPALAGFGLDGNWDVLRTAAPASLLPSALFLWVFFLPYPPHCFDLLLSLKVLRNLSSHDVGQSNENDTLVYFTTFLGNVNGSYINI